MAKKKKAAKGSKKNVVEKKVSTYKPVDIPKANDGWVRINLKLVNWTFDNMSIVTRTTTPLYSLVRNIKEKHGHVKELTLYRGQVNPNNQLAELDTPLAELGFEGADRVEDAKSFTVYYDFKPVLEGSPLLLVTPRTEL